MEKENIKRLLIEIKNDISKIIELENFNIETIIDIALEEELFDSLITIFQPITLNGKVKIYFDAFSTDILQKILYTCDTKEQAEKEAKEEYEHNQERNKTLSEEDKEWFYDGRTYEEIFLSKKVIPKEFKDALKESLFKPDMDLIKRIKIKDSHARQISGIGHPINSIEDVIFYAEPSCIEACIDLFNKNIKTTMNDTEGVIEDGYIKNAKCFITCDYKSLSEENKTIFDELIQSGIARRFIDGSIDSVSIDVPCNREETVGDISDKFMAIIAKLKKQDVLYGRQTLEEFYENDFLNLANIFRSIYAKYFDKAECTWDDVIMFANEFGYFYDSEEDILWDSKTLYDRHKKYTSSIPPQSSTPMKL